MTQDIDGRAARSGRTRDSVINVVLDLVQQGNPRPTARQMAERAGISLRSVYVHFDDLDDLFLAVASEYGRRLTPLLEPIDATLPLGDRIAAWADQRCAIWEANAAVRRAADLWAPTSPALANVINTARELGFANTTRLFEQDCERVPDGVALLEIIKVLGTAATWDTLRGRGAPAADARDILAASLTKIMEK